MPVPGRPEAADNFIRQMVHVQQPPDSAVPGRELTDLEEKVYSAALRVLLRYFTGEMDYVDYEPIKAAGEEKQPTDGQGANSKGGS